MVIYFLIILKTIMHTEIIHITIDNEYTLFSIFK